MTGQTGPKIGLAERTERFTQAIQRGQSNRSVPPAPNPTYHQMLEAHRGALKFMQDLQRTSQEILDAYNQAAESSGIRTQAGWKVIPGRFDREASEYGQEGGVPWLVLTDLANGVDIWGAAFTRHEPEGPTGQPPDKTGYCPDKTGYRLAGTGMVFTNTETSNARKAELEGIAGNAERSLERHLEEQRYR